MGLTVIHRGAPEAVDSVVQRLNEAGVNAVPIDRPSFLILLVTFGTYRVRVGVPDEEVETAREILREWDVESGPLVSALTRQLRRQLALSAAPAIVVALVAIVVVDGWDRVPWLACAAPALFLLSFLVLSIRTRARGS